jgi:hypothetical protein
VFDPWHYVPVLARKPGALRNGAPFKDWLLPGALERVRCKLAAARDGDRQMVDILTAVLSDGLTAVEAACAEALREGVHSADVILNILARQREPMSPVTILTPEALRLRHEPAANCGGRFYNVVDLVNQLEAEGRAGRHPMTSSRGHGAFRVSGPGSRP